MTSWSPGDEVEAALQALRVHDAARDKVERTRARCVAILEARWRAEAPKEAPGPAWRTWLEPAFAVGLGALFLAEAVARALAVYR